jgi:hypothetical protein
MSGDGFVGPLRDLQQGRRMDDLFTGRDAEPSVTLAVTASSSPIVEPTQ